jgi:ribose transport system substrate-binding protein
MFDQINVAIEMARNGLIKGVGAQRPYDQGVVEALLAGYGLLGNPRPPTLHFLLFR